MRLKFICLVLSALMLGACGGGDSTPQTGQVLLTNGLIAGIDYQSESPDGKSSISGMTDASGVAKSVRTYQVVNSPQGNSTEYAQAPITYSIGGGFSFTLPNLLPWQQMSVLQSDGTTTKTVDTVPYYTLLDVTTDPNQLTNIDTVLETLSSTPTSAGITITKNIQQAQLPSFNNATTTLATDIIAIKTAADTADPSVTHTVPTPAQALAHVKGSWQCAMVGFYTGSGFGNALPTGYRAASIDSYLVLLPNGTLSGFAINRQSATPLSGTLEFPSQTVTTTAMLDIGNGAPESVTFNFVWAGPRQLASSANWTSAEADAGTLVATLKQAMPTTPVLRFAAAPVTWTANGYVQNSALIFDVDASNNVGGSMIADLVYSNNPSPWYGSLSGNTLTATVPNAKQTDTGYDFKFVGTIDPNSGDITTGTLQDHTGTPVAYITPNAPMTHCQTSGFASS